jgi:hypothetical protein
MASAIIGALRVNLGIDTAAFTSGMKSAESRLAKFGQAMKTGLMAAAAAGVAALGALAVGIKSTINAADDMGKMAQKFGVPVEELSRLKHAADLSGVAMEGLGTGLRKLSQNMNETANGANNAASQAFSALGISVTDADGRLKSSSAVMTEIAGKLSHMQDGAQKTAIAMAIFGRSGADLIPMLNAGASGLSAMMAEADALGIVISGSTAKAAEAFNDNLTRMGTITSAMVTKITAHMLPALEDFAAMMVQSANNTDAMQMVADGLIGVLKALASVAIGTAQAFRAVAAAIGGAWNAAKLFFEMDFSGSSAALMEGISAAGDEIAKAQSAITQVWDAGAGGMSMRQFRERTTGAFGAVGAGAGEEFVANFEKATKGGGARTRTALDPMVAEAKRVFEATRTPLEAYQASIARLNELLAAGAINQDTYNRAVVQAQDAFKQAEEAGKKTKGVMEGIGQSISSSFASAFSGLIDGSKKVKDVLRDLLSQLTSMLLNKAFTSLFSGVFGGGGALGGIGKLFGFAKGGTILPGGGGGVDSQLVAFRKSPNERVDITKPGQTLHSGGQMVDVRVFVDDNGNFDAKVERISQGQIGKAAPAILDRSRSQILPTVADYQGNRAGSDFRVG